MAIRGFIIAIEDYGQHLHRLPGVVEQAAEFRKWLVEKKQVNEDNIFACVSGNPGWETAGTEIKDILKEILRLKEEGKNKTEELFFYISGHGFSLPLTPDKDIDILVCSDYDGPNAGRACISLDEIKEKLYRMLGPGNHYYFIDACRNIINDVQVPLTGLKTDSSELGSPTVYMLFSTASGSVAKTTSRFSSVLVEGLSGKGIAKDWKGHRLWVLFDRLCEFVKEKIKKQEILSSKEGTEDGKILEIVPIPQVECVIKINNAEKYDTFEISINTAQGTIKTEKFTGQNYTVQLRPGYYSISLASDPPGSAEIIQTNPSPSGDSLPLFDTYEIKFEKRVKSINTGGFTGNFPIGDADAAIGFVHDRFIKAGGDIVHRVKPPKDKPINEISKYILDKASKKVLTGISRTAQQVKSGDKPDLALLLSLLGASQIVLNSSENNELFKLQLTCFDDMSPHTSEVYILAGFEITRGHFDIAVGEEKDVKWQRLSKRSEIKGLYEKRVQALPGSNLLSIKIPQKPSLTYSTYCLPNRVTLFVIAEDSSKQINVHQFILPVHHLFGFLDPEVIQHLTYDPLKIIKSVFLAQAQFALKRPLAGKIDMGERQWKDLINGKWLDPIMSIIGVYELIRRGQADENRKYLKTMFSNLRQYFPGLPDTEAIAKLAGEPWNMPIGPPLLLDGMLTFDDDQERAILQMPPDKIDYSSPWTRWYGVF